MKWEHKCSLEWLQQRQKHLTASDIKKLLPFTPTGRARKITDEDRMRVLSSKLANLTEDDCMSYGAAARGHILEPYAVSDLNNIIGKNMFYHWDDILVTGEVDPILGFSPDAADVPMSEPFSSATAIAEIKSYSDEKHLCRYYGDKTKFEERWQIAHAMATRYNIDVGYLIFYNPRFYDSFSSLAAFMYTRVDLMKEIETIMTIVDDWEKFLTSNHCPPPLYFGGCTYSEQKIYELEKEKAGLNP